MKTTQLPASEKLACGVRSQRNLRHACRRFVAGMVFALPTHTMVTWYCPGFGRSHKRNRDSVLCSAYLPDGSEAMQSSPEITGVAVESNAVGA
jgi:hypothetical protein